MSDDFIIDQTFDIQPPVVDDEFAVDQISAGLEKGTSPLEQLIGDETILQRGGQEVARKVSSAIRGGAVPMLGAQIGSMLPGTPFHKAVYSLVGGLALPATELGAIALNKMGLDVGSPYEALQKFYTDLGLPESQTNIEKDIEAFFGGAGGVKKAATMFGKNNPKSLMAINPNQQAILSGSQAAGAQELINEGMDPLEANLYSFGATAPFSIFGNKRPIGQSSFEKKLEANQLYNFADQSGVKITKNNSNDLYNRILQNAKDDDIDIMNLGVNQYGAYKNTSQSLTEKSVKTLNNIMTRLKNKDLSLNELEKVRRTIGNEIPSASKNDQRILIGMRDTIDDFIENSDPNMFFGGKEMGRAEVQAIQKARDLWKQAGRSDYLNDIFRSAELRAASSQRDYEKILVSKLATLADNPKKFNKFSQVEKQAIEDFIKGGSFTKFMRSTSQFLDKASLPLVATGLTMDYGASSLIPTMLSSATNKVANAAVNQGAANLENILRLGRQPTLLEMAEANLVNPAMISGLLGGRSAINYGTR